MKHLQMNVLLKHIIKTIIKIQAIISFLNLCESITYGVHTQKLSIL